MSVLGRIAQVSAVAAIAWGLLAFGAVYFWAWRILVVLCLVMSAASLLRSADGLRALGWPLASSCVLLLAAIWLQTVPIPPAVVERLSPETLPVVRQLDVSYVAAGGRDPHPFSIQPGATSRALLLGATFLLLIPAVASLLSWAGTRWLLRAVMVLGSTVAVAAIAFRFSGRTLVFGFWAPEATHATPFGPFVNPNHYAGWMLMAVPLCAALACADLTRLDRGSFASFRERVLWLGSSKGAGVILSLSAAFVMSISVVLTMSRMAIALLCASLMVMAVLAARRLRARTARLLPIAVAVFLVLGVAVTVGLDVVEKRYASADWDQLNDRRGAWADALSVARTFPLTGTGLNTYGLSMLLFQRHNLERHYAQAHNDYLQLAAEGGLLLGVPALIVAVLLAARIRTRLREAGRSETAWWARTGAVIGLLAIALQALVDFSLQMPGNAALFAVLCGIAIHRDSRPGAEPVRSRRHV